MSKKTLMITIVTMFMLLTTGCFGSAAGTADTKADAAKSTSDQNRVAVFDTNKGQFTVELFEDKAPQTTKNFITLVEKGFYNNLIFHRVIAGFMIQGGDPEGTGMGGPRLYD